MGLNALDRLIANVETTPFALTMSFNNPHPPFISTSSYLDKYYYNQSDLFVSPSIDDIMENTPYNYADLRRKFKDAGVDYSNKINIAELTAIYCKFESAILSK